MNDNQSSGTAAGVSLPASFSVRPYQADGGFSFGGAMQLVGFLGLAGIILGAAASFVSRFFYLILLFPIAIGAGIGIVGNWSIKTLKIRRPWTCGVAGFIAGCLAMLSMHHFDYQHFQSEVEQELGEDLPAMQAIARNLAQARSGLEELPEEERAGLQDFIIELEQNTEFRELLQVDSFPSYMQFQARQGVELKRAARGGKGINLGYTGSWIYWIVEALIVAGVAFAMMKGEASNPFCVECFLWKTPASWGPFSKGTLAGQMLSEGRIEPLTYEPDSKGVDVIVTAHRCPQCGDNGEFDVKVEQLKVNKKGEVQRSQIAHVTYPPEAYAALVAACTPETEDTNSPDPDQPGGDRQDSAS